MRVGEDIRIRENEVVSLADWGLRSNRLANSTHDEILDYLHREEWCILCRLAPQRAQRETIDLRFQWIHAMFPRRLQTIKVKLVNSEPNMIQGKKWENTM